MLHSVDSAARLLGLSKWTVRSWIRARRIPSITIGRRILIEEVVIRDLIEKGRRLPLQLRERRRLELRGGRVRSAAKGGASRGGRPSRSSQG